MSTAGSGASTASTILRIGNFSDIVEAEHIVIERLEKVSRNPTIQEVYFWNIEFTPNIVKALHRLIHCNKRHFTIKILSCRGLVAEAVSTLLVTNNVPTTTLQKEGGEMEDSENEQEE